VLGKIRSVKLQGFEKYPTVRLCRPLLLVTCDSLGSIDVSPVWSSSTSLSSITLSSAGTNKRVFRAS